MAKPGEIFVVAGALATSAAAFGWLASADRDHHVLLAASAVEVALAIAALVASKHTVWRLLRTWSLLAVASVVGWLAMSGRHAYRGDLRDENFRLTVVLAARAVLFAIAYVVLGREAVRKSFPPPYAVE